MPNKEPALTWPFGNGPERVGTQGLFRLCLKTFVAPFLPARLTAPGSPRMQFETPPVVSPRNNVWEMSAEIPYWWCVTTPIWLVVLIGWSRFPTRHDQSEQLPRSFPDPSLLLSLTRTSSYNSEIIFKSSPSSKAIPGYPKPVMYYTCVFVPLVFILLKLVRYHLQAVSCSKSWVRLLRLRNCRPRNLWNWQNLRNLEKWLFLLTTT